MGLLHWADSSLPLVFFINQVYWNTATPIAGMSMIAFTVQCRAELLQQRPYGRQSSKYLLCGFLQKKRASSILGEHLEVHMSV